MYLKFKIKYKVMKTKFITDGMQSGRLNSHGEIITLSSGFSLENDYPFTIFIIPKANISNGIISQPTEIGLIVNCSLYADDIQSDCPFILGQWSEAYLSSLGVNSIDLDIYRLFWGSGFKVN